MPTAELFGCFLWCNSGANAPRVAGTREADAQEDYRGLFWRRPVLASVFTLMLLSLAGIPVTAGFIGKFYIVAAGASSAMWALHHRERESGEREQ